jgi:acetylornithine deacetylase
VQAEVEDWIRRAADADPWLRTHPPRVEWVEGAVPPAEVSVDEPIVQVLLGAQRDLGRASRIGGLDNWHDGATLTVEAGIPAVCFGPGDIRHAHAVDEHVPIADLVACAQGIAVAAARFCGVVAVQA